MAVRVIKKKILCFLLIWRSIKSTCVTQTALSIHQCCSTLCSKGDASEEATYFSNGHLRLLRLLQRFHSAFVCVCACCFWSVKSSWATMKLKIIITKSAYVSLHFTSACQNIAFCVFLWSGVNTNKITEFELVL